MDEARIREIAEENEQMARAMWGDGQDATEYDEFAWLAREVLRMREADRWIPVSERLPDGEEVVQVWRTDRSFHLDTAECFFDQYGMRYWGMEVSHWRPLPTPPEPPTK